MEEGPMCYILQPKTTCLELVYISLCWTKFMLLILILQKQKGKMNIT